MKNLPKIISTKDAAYLEDIFNWHIITAYKYDLYLNMVQDKTIAQKLEELLTMHLDFCATAVKLLESGENNE